MISQEQNDICKEYIKSIVDKSKPNISTPQGFQCINPSCRDFVLWAEPNLPNNQFMCFRCRDSEPWRYKEYQNLNNHQNEE